MSDLDALVYSASVAIRPWRSVDSVTGREGGSLQIVLKSDVAAQDTQKDIDKCLSCKRLYCTNCLDQETDEEKLEFVPKKLRLVPKQLPNQMAMEL